MSQNIKAELEFFFCKKMKIMKDDVDFEKKNMQKTDKKVEDIQTRIRHTSISTKLDYKGAERKKGAEAIFKEVTADNFPQPRIIPVHRLKRLNKSQAGLKHLPQP